MLHKSVSTSVPSTPPKGKAPRYLCQFRDSDTDYFTTDCSMPTYEQAVAYCTRIYMALDSVAEANVLLDGDVIWNIKDTPDIPGFATVDLNPRQEYSPVAYIHVWFGGEGKPLVEIDRGISVDNPKPPKQYYPSKGLLKYLDRVLRCNDVHFTGYHNGWTCTVKTVYPPPAWEAEDV